MHFFLGRSLNGTHLTLQKAEPEVTAVWCYCKCFYLTGHQFIFFSISVCVCVFVCIRVHVCVGAWVFMCVYVCVVIGWLVGMSVDVMRMCMGTYAYQFLDLCPR